MLALATAARWLLRQVLQAKDLAITYRDEQIAALRGQITRQQDLFDQALVVLKEALPRRGR